MGTVNLDKAGHHSRSVFPHLSYGECGLIPRAYS